MWSIPASQAWVASRHAAALLSAPTGHSAHLLVTTATMSKLSNQAPRMLRRLPKHIKGTVAAVGVVDLPSDHRCLRLSPAFLVYVQLVVRAHLHDTYLAT